MGRRRGPKRPKKVSYELIERNSIAGSPMYVLLDDLGRRVYRMRRHDLEEFSVIAARYGCYKRDIEHFAQSLDKSRASSTVFIGPEKLRHRLAAAGLIVPVADIWQWSDADRRDAF